MTEPRTHYQVSFTARQALSVFIGLLAVLGLSYFLGLMTGLAGSGAPEEAAASAPAAGGAAGEGEPFPPPSPVADAGSGAAENLTFPIPVTAARSAGSSSPAPATTVEVFEDGEPAGGAAAPARVVTAKPAAATSGFRIQVLSVSSRADAEAEAARLTRSGLPARVEPGNGPRGTVYRVRVGPYATREEAEEAGRRLSAQGRRDAWIVSPGQ